VAHEGHSAPQAGPPIRHGSHTGHDEHAGHAPETFRDRLVVSVILTLPILYYSDQAQQWLGYRAIRFPGSDWVTAVLSVVIYLYGGWVFLKGAREELADRSPGMMTLVAMAITVAFLFSIAVSLGLPGMPFYWELATLIDVMLLGHWMEMLSIQGASRALEHLACRAREQRMCPWPSYARATASSSGQANRSLQMASWRPVTQASTKRS
jgi:Cu2+-exporting ATPase